MEKQRTKRSDRPARPHAEREEKIPTWRNTRPRGNPDIDRTDLERGKARWETLLGS
jgi:hypothetical protein